MFFLELIVCIGGDLIFLFVGIFNKVWGIVVFVVLLLFGVGSLVVMVNIVWFIIGIVLGVIGIVIVDV